MNDKSKTRLQKMNKQLIDTLESSFNVSVYQDQVSEEEEEQYHYFIFETGGFSKGESNYTLRQEVLVRYYSENRDDLDERMLDIITLLEGVQYTFQNSNKTAIQKGDIDAYVDEIELVFTRLVKYGV